MNGTAGHTMTKTIAATNAVESSGANVARSYPDSKSPTLTLGFPTPAEIRAQAKSNASAWRGALSLEAYLRREEHLATQGLCKDGGITYWILYDTLEEGPGRRVLAGCETLRKRALVSHNGQVKDIIVHGVGSVFTPPEFRGRSYGGRMMAELSARLQNWQAEGTPCLASVLYSDIGKKFYTKFGWRPFTSAHIHLRPDPTPYTNGHTQPQALPLYDADLRELCELDEAHVRSKMEKRHTGTAVALIADHKTIEWHHAREKFVANELYGRIPTIKGAIAHVGDDRIWCVWSRLWYNQDPRATQDNVMYILRLVIEDRNADKDGSEHSLDHLVAIAAVLRFAQREAHEWHMGEVELWNPDASTLSAARLIDPTVKVVERDSESIASLRWYGAPEAETDVEWLENDKAGWC